jgi:hypothetical protein
VRVSQIGYGSPASLLMANACAASGRRRLDAREIARFRQDSERNDHDSRAGGRVIDVQQDHDGPGKRKCKGRRQNAGTIDFASNSFGKAVYARHLLGGEAAQQSDRMSQHGVLGAGGFGHRRKEKQICGRPEEGKTEGLCVNNASSVSNAIGMKLLRAT